MKKQKPNKQQNESITMRQWEKAITQAFNQLVAEDEKRYRQSHK